MRAFIHGVWHHGGAWWCMVEGLTHRAPSKRAPALADRDVLSSGISHYRRVYTYVRITDSCILNYVATLLLQQGKSNISRVDAMTKKIRNAEYNGLDRFYGLCVNTFIDERTMSTHHFSYTQANVYFLIIVQDVFFKFPDFILRPMFAPVSR